MMKPLSSMTASHSIPTSLSDRIVTAPYSLRQSPACRIADPHNKTRRLILQGSGLLFSTLWGSKPRRGESVFAEEEQNLTEKDKEPAKGFDPTTCDDLTVTKSVFFDVAIDGEAAGRIVIGLYGNDVPVGASRFAELAAGKKGVGYRKKEFIKITPTYIQNAGLRYYGVDAEMSKRDRIVADDLVDEAQGLEKKCKGTRTFRGAVGLIVRDPSKPPPQIKLVTKGGRFQIKEEEVKPDPNGTEFVIATKNAEDLGSSSLLVGRVLSGMDVVDRIGSVKAVQDNTKSPYFQVAKLIGDKRATVAERGFNRPYSKIVITKCGELD